MTHLKVILAGPLTLVQDRGRPGLAHLGMGTAGAMDRAALALASRLVGNDADAAGLEILFGGAEFQADGPVWVAVAGAWGDVTVAGRSIDPYTATRMDAGERLTFGPAGHGIRYYLAVRGGIDVPRVLGSRSRDTLAGLGPPPLVEGDTLEVGSEPASPIPPVDTVPLDPPSTGPVTLALRPGPRREWFSTETWALLLHSEWQVSPRSDRSGVRLEGPVLERTDARELPSEGMVPGAIQVSPDGVPTVLAVDHPVTGGYPVIAVVTDDSLDALAQLRPGQAVRFLLATGR